MGIFNNNTDSEESNKISITKTVSKSIVKLFASKFMIILLVLMLGTIILQYAFELITAEKTPEQIYETLEVEDMKELIQIVGNDSSGYHLEFVDDIDDKIDKIIDVLGSKSGMYVINEKDSDILKKMILAEAYTQFPNLGGNYNEENEEFQGAVKVRRVTPNKEIGEMKNTGTGEVTTLGNEKEEDVIEDKKSSPTVKSGAELIVEENSDLYVKGTYDENGEKTSESGVTLAKEALNNNTLFSTGKILYYTGQYIVHEDNTYFEVKEEKDGQVKGYINASTIRVKTNGGNKVNNSGTGSDVIGDENKEYILAIAAGHNSTDDTGAASGEFIEQDMTIKVAEKVEELCSKYSNLKVVQTGSTSENPGGVGMRDRVQLAKEANPDLCIQIHFNAGGGTGVEAWYEYGDGYSAALAEILSNHMSEKMGLENRGAQTKENNSQYWAIIDSYSQTNFPSVITEGGFLDNATDQEVLRSNGIDKYAEAIVEGCIEYLTSDHSDLNSTFVESVTEASGIESKVYDLKYKDPADFDKLVNEDSKEALNYYTLDDSFNIITATWSYDGNSIDINTNAPVDFRTTLQNVTMPYEYLLYFLIDSGNKNFVRELSDMVADSEIVMAVQDDVTTTDINATVQQRKNANIDDYDTNWSVNNSRSSEESSFTETSRTSVSITYADVWCARYSRENESYSAYSLGVEKDDTVNTTINVRGSVKDQRDTDIKDAYAITDTQNGTDSKEVIGKYGTPEMKTIEYTYVIEEKYTKSIHTISNSYEEGEPVVDEKINKFINLYKEHKMANSVKEKWLFQILEKNSKTANMVDLTKYLIYRATGTSYGVEEFDFSIFDLSKFETTGSALGGFSTFIEYLHSWEGHEGISADGTKYRVGDDGAGNPTVGYGIDIYKSGFLDRFIAAGYDVSMGAYIDVEFVDALEKEEIQNAIQLVETKCAGLNLTQYQKYALVSRIYNCGSAGAFWGRYSSDGKDFITAFTSYWNHERDDEFQTIWDDSLFNHPLYTTYMSRPTNSASGFMLGLKLRRESEWKLFRTGYYDRIDKWCTGGSSATSALDALPNYNAGTSSGFGWRIHPIYGDSRFHQGTDISAPTGTEIASLGSGVVKTMEFNSARGYYIIIDHQNGYETVYQHCSSFATGLSVGSPVSQGQIIAYVGSTGASTGAHLHMEILVPSGSGEHSSYFSGYDVVNPETFDYSNLPG